MRRIYYAIPLMLILLLIWATLFLSNIYSASEMNSENTFMSAESAVSIAESHYQLTVKEGIPVGAFWEDGKIGDPLLVRDIYGNPAYWKVPVEYKSRVVGYLDINKEGTVLRFGGYYQDVGDLDDGILVVPEMTPDYVKNMASDIIAQYPGSVIGEPILVFTEINDAWMLDVRYGNEVVSKIFVTPAYVFETVLQEFNEESGLWQTVVQPEPGLAGIFISFEEGVTESEVRSILEIYNFTMNYELKYNVNYSTPRWYIAVNKDIFPSVKDELLNTQYFIQQGMYPTDLLVTIKGNRSIIGFEESPINDEDVLEILRIHDLKIEKILECYVEFDRRNGIDDLITHENATRIQNELEGNDKILLVYLDYPDG